MPYIDFMYSLHKATKRDYLARVNGTPKAEAAKLAKQWGYDYWDGSRDVGYGGYHYDGRWKPVAHKMIQYYRLPSGAKVLDIGCGKGFLLYELQQMGMTVAGLDISGYALQNATEEVKPYLQQGNAPYLPFPDGYFDLILSINTLHNLPCYDMLEALREIERVGTHKYLCVESFRTEEEKVNLLYWQITCNCFFSPEEWQWWFKQAGYTGDYSFIYFT